MHSNHTATARAGNAVYLKPSFPTERHQLLQTAKFHHSRRAVRHIMRRERFSLITSSPQLIHSGARPDHRRLPLASTSLRRPPDPKRCACCELESASMKHSTLETCSVMSRTLSQSYSCSPLTHASRTASYSWPEVAAMGGAAETERQRANPTDHRPDRQAMQQYRNMSDRCDDFACMISHSQVSHVDFACIISHSKVSFRIPSGQMTAESFTQNVTYQRRWRLNASGSPRLQKGACETVHALRSRRRSILQWSTRDDFA